MISTLTYVSTLRGSVDTSELRGLLDDSRTRNAELGVTGLLLVRDRAVMQILEGDDNTVRTLYERIRSDSRHRDVRQVWAGTHSQRRFPDWSMGYEDLDQPDSLSSIVAATPSPSAEHRTFLNRRIMLLRRGLASGHRLISALAVILDAHDPETMTADGTTRLRCREGCAPVDPQGDGYPCSTALNAFWALDATL